MLNTRVGLSMSSVKPAISVQNKHSLRDLQRRLKALNPNALVNWDGIGALWLSWCCMPDQSL
jgi:hypothetical protein